MSIGRAIVKGITEMDPFDRYALPIVGSSFRNVDQYADYQRMYSDYMRNVGKTIKYPSIRDYRANAGNSLSAAIGSPLTLGMKAAGKTVRSLI